MTRLIWTTDLHWERLHERERQEFFESVAELRGDGLIISGDFGEAANVLEFLQRLHEETRLPIYFVLGNHDFYFSSFAKVRAAIRQFVQTPGYFWLTECPPLSLGDDVALIGHEGWADARLGDYNGARQAPLDFQHIEELAGLTKQRRLELLQQLGDEAAAALRQSLTAALQTHRHVLCVTHVPPYRETCVDSSGRVNEERLPFYTCHALGQMFREVMSSHPDHSLTVLCGHTHEEADARVLPNLRVIVKSAAYGIAFTPRVISLEQLRKGSR
jgi:Icc protein